MSVVGLFNRSVQRLRAEGPRSFTKLMLDRYWDPLASYFFRGGRVREFVIGDDFPLSVPAFDARELGLVFAELEKLSALSDVPTSLDVRIAVLSDSRDLPPTPALKFRVQVVPVTTVRLVLGFVLWSGNVYVPEYANPDRASALRQTLGRLGVEPLATLEDIRDRIASRMQVRLSGPVRSARPTFRSLKERLSGAHYGYREAMDMKIVRELPLKFEYFAKHCEVNYLPTRDLNRYPGRVSRQYAVGAMYKEPYFSGASVLDVGCDIRGISEYVGPNTRYVGVDIQGLADVCIDLDAEDLPFDPCSFETVLCFEVLEHLNKIHKAFDQMLAIAERYFVGSLFVESGVYRGRSVSAFGEALGNMQLPIAPVFDRHEWIFNAADALDFIYYRSRRAGFRVIRLDLFYDDARIAPFQVAQLRRAMRNGDVGRLSKNVEMIGFVVERERAAGSSAAS